MTKDERSMRLTPGEVKDALRRLDQEINAVRDKLYQMDDPSNYDAHAHLHNALDKLINEYTGMVERRRRGQ